MNLNPCATCLIRDVFGGLNRIGDLLPQLGLRLLLAYEFRESGMEKLRGENGFADIQGQFAFPFSLIPTEFSWQIATRGELIGPVPWRWGWAPASPACR